MISKDNAVSTAAKMFLILSTVILLLHGYPRDAVASVRNSLSLGYDSFIDRFTILEDDTTEAIQELYLALDNSLDLSVTGRRLLLMNDFRYGTQTVNENLSGILTIGSRRSKYLELRSSFRMKFFREGSDYAFGNDYWQSNSHLRFGRTFSSGWKLSSRSRVEIIDFEKKTDFDYDYYYLDTGFEIEKGSYFSDFVRLELSAGHREAPDTTTMSYERLLSGIEIRASTGDRSMFEFSLTGDRRNYGSGVRSPSWNIYSWAGLTHSSPGGARYSLRLESESYIYDRPSTTFINTHFIRSGFRVSKPVGAKLTLFAEPRLAGMLCRDYQEEKYSEITVIVGLDLIGNGRYWLNFSYEPGYRNYILEPNDIYSDFYLNRLSFMGGWTIRPGLSVDLFASHDPERHMRRDDDFSITMISVSVSVDF